MRSRPYAIDVERAILAALGALFLLQGVAKAVDPTSYMLALAQFRVIAPVTTTPLSLAAVALAWTVLEVASGVSLMHGALARERWRHGRVAGAFVALGLTAAYLTLELGALVRGVSISNATLFGALVRVPLSLATIVLQGCLAFALAHVLRLAVPRHTPVRAFAW